MGKDSSSNETASSSSLIYNSCCCCFDLRTGCFILGYFNLVAVILLLLTIIVGLVFVRIAANNSELVAEMPPEILASVCVFFVILLMSLGFCIVLLNGLHKNIPEHVKAYLIYNLVLLITCSIILTGFGLYYLPSPAFIIVVIIQGLFPADFLYIIKCYYVVMRRDSPKYKPYESVYGIFRSSNTEV